MMLKAQAEDSSHAMTSQQLLAAAPMLIAGAEQLHPALSKAGLLERKARTANVENLARLIFDVLNEINKDELTRAQQLLRLAGSAPKPPTIRMTAALDYLHRSVRDHGDATLQDLFLGVSEPDFAIPKLLSELVAQVKVADRSPLQGANVLACRHLLGSTIAELHALTDAVPGLKFHEVMGKPYSANPLVVHKLLDMGIEVRLESCDMPMLEDQPFGSYAARHGRIARAVVDRFVRMHGQSTKPLLVIDDGGALISAVGKKVTSGHITAPVVAIEQTTHGLHAAQEFARRDAKRNGFVLISVADSRAKLDQESPMIARSTIAHVEQWLSLLHSMGRLRKNRRLTSMRVAIIGFGPVGALIANELRSDIEPVVFDRNRRKLVLARAAGFEVAWSLAELLPTADVVIAASGGTSIDSDATRYLKDDAILFSASSGDMEFSGLNTWSTAIVPVLPTNGLTAFDASHGLVIATHRDQRTVYVPNRGFPVNFDGSLDPISIEDIQLTRALMVGAVIQAAGRAGKQSLVGATAKVHLDQMIDDFISAEFDKIRAGRRQHADYSLRSQTVKRSKKLLAALGTH